MAYFEFLEALEEDWHPVGKAALIGWLGFYGLFLLHALRAEQGTLADLVFLPIHEGGHLLFGYLGETMGVLGGTLLQLLVPLALAVSFAFRRHLPGTAFCAFFFFVNFLNVGTYMADARAQELPLVTVGGGDDVEHDWYVIFSSLGLLESDSTIGGLTRALGWLGMLATLAWLTYRAKMATR